MTFVVCLSCGENNQDDDQFLFDLTHSNPAHLTVFIDPPPPFLGVYVCVCVLFCSLSKHTTTTLLYYIVSSSYQNQIKQLQADMQNLVKKLPKGRPKESVSELDDKIK